MNKHTRKDFVWPVRISEHPSHDGLQISESSERKTLQRNFMDPSKLNGSLYIPLKKYM